MPAFDAVQTLGNASWLRGEEEGTSRFEVVNHKDRTQLPFEVVDSIPTHCVGYQATNIQGVSRRTRK